MFTFAKIIADAVGGHVIQITGAVFACIVASEAYRTLAAAAAPITTALN